MDNVSIIFFLQINFFYFFFFGYTTSSTLKQWKGVQLLWKFNFSLLYPCFGTIYLFEGMQWHNWYNWNSESEIFFQSKHGFACKLVMSFRELSTFPVLKKHYQHFKVLKGAMINTKSWMSFFFWDGYLLHKTAKTNHSSRVGPQWALNYSPWLSWSLEETPTTISFKPSWAESWIANSKVLFFLLN